MECTLFLYSGVTQRLRRLTELAPRLHVSRLSVSELLHEKRALSPEMAARLAKLTNTTPESWLTMQNALDLWRVAQNPERLSGIEPVELTS